MANVSVKDVAEIRLFSVGVQRFQEDYERQLIMVEHAIDEDRYTAKELLQALEEKLRVAERHLQACEESLRNYLSDCAGRRDENGDSIPPNPEVVEQLREAIRKAEERVVRARRHYQEGVDIEYKARLALDMAASTVSSGKGIIRDAVSTACSVIERAAQQIEIYKG